MSCPFLVQSLFVILLLLPLVTGAALAGSESPPKPTVHLISEQGSERATTGEGNKLVTRDGKTYVVWQDSTAKGYLNQIARFDHATGGLTGPVTLNVGKDNHARPTIVIGPRGYLHAVISGHNSPVVYRRSKNPGEVSSWTEPQTIGKGTYPVPVCAPDGTLYVVMRSAEHHNGVDFYAKPPGGDWRQRAKLVYRDPQYPGYAAFHSGLAVAPDGTIHAVINFYEGKGVHDQRGLHQAVTYMRSSDGGRSWTRADGTPIQTPARPARMDVLARDTASQRHEPQPPPVILATGNIVVDGRDRPHILYIDHRRAPGQLMHATVDADGNWSSTPIHLDGDVFADHRPIQGRGALTIGKDGAMFALLILYPTGEGWDHGLPTRALHFKEDVDKRLVWMVSRDNGQTWSESPALPNGESFNGANVERATGSNQLPADGFPPFVYFDGANRYPGDGTHPAGSPEADAAYQRDGGEIIQNRVYLVLPSHTPARSSSQ